MNKSQKYLFNMWPRIFFSVRMLARFFLTNPPPQKKQEKIKWSVPKLVSKTLSMLGSYYFYHLCAVDSHYYD